MNTSTEDSRFIYLIPCLIPVFSPSISVNIISDIAQYYFITLVYTNSNLLKFGDVVQYLCWNMMLAIFLLRHSALCVGYFFLK